MYLPSFLTLILACLCGFLYYRDYTPRDDTLTDTMLTFLHSVWDANEIVPGIYLGSYAASIPFQYIQQHHITLIISIGNFQPQLIHHGIQYIIIDAEDEPQANLITHLEYVTSAIYHHINTATTASTTVTETSAHDDVMSGGVKATTPRAKTNPGILIHCMQGRSRSATLVAAYLIRYHQHSVTSAIQHLQHHRPFVRPNPGFIRQLHVYHDIQFAHPSHRRHLMAWLQSYLNHPHVITNPYCITFQCHPHAAMKWGIWDEFLFHVYWYYYGTILPLMQMQHNDTC